MKIKIVKDYAALSNAAGQIIADLLRNNPSCNLGLATGSTPLGTYQYLTAAFKAGDFSMRQVRTFNLDEYCGLPRCHPESYHSFMYRNLFAHVDTLEENMHIPYTEGTDLQEQCARYNALLNTYPIDLQLLGIGSNGHIGFCEPGTAFDQETFVAQLSEATRQDNQRFFNSLEEVPSTAITMGIGNIMRARSVLLIASGEAKAECINQMINGPVTEAVPASVLQNHPDATIIIDEAAASRLSGKTAVHTN